MEAKKVKEQFDLVAKQYDSQRRGFIPCFDDYYVRSVSLLKQYNKSFEKIVDLGAGTGLLTKEIYSLYPNARYVLVDLSEDMLDVARKRFNGLDNFKYVKANYIESIPGGDLICSGLSIHHLENDEKKLLYNNVYKTLPGGGCFINLDQFNSSSTLINEMYTGWWLDYIDNSGITEDERNAWLERKKIDRENSVEDTVSMLRNCGFKDVQCIYSFMKFAVILAIK